MLLVNVTNSVPQCGVPTVHTVLCGLCGLCSIHTVEHQSEMSTGSGRLASRVGWKILEIYFCLLENFIRFFTVIQPCPC